MKKNNSTGTKRVQSSSLLKSPPSPRVQIGFFVRPTSAQSDPSGQIHQEAKTHIDTCITQIQVLEDNFLLSDIAEQQTYDLAIGALERGIELYQSLPPEVKEGDLDLPKKVSSLERLLPKVTTKITPSPS